MSVVAVCGLPGTGKTLFCTYLARKQFKKENSRLKKIIRKIKKIDVTRNVVFSNYPINFDKNNYSNMCSLFDMARWNKYYMDSIFIFDEFQLYFDSLDFKNFPKNIRNTFQLHRHFGIDNIFIISQHPSRIVKQARVLITEFYEITKFVKIPFTGLAFFRYNIYYNYEDFGKPVNVKKSEVVYRFSKKIKFFRYKKVFRSYDTKYFKKLVEDSDFIPRIPYACLAMDKVDILENYRFE